MNILIIGGSRNIGYFTSLHFLEAGHTVTFLLRNPTIFDNDEHIQRCISSKQAFLVKGDALIRDDVKQAWASAAINSSSNSVDLLLFTVGGTPKFHVLNGMSSHHQTFSHAALPLILKPFYAYLLASPHRDKVGAERVISYVAGWPWNTVEDGEPVSEVLDMSGKWKEEMPEEGALRQHVLVVRPALLTDGDCLAKKEKGGKVPYRVSEEELGGWSVSRKDVAHFVAEAAMNRWEEFQGKRVSIAY